MAAARKPKTRLFLGLSAEERQAQRRERLLEAGLQTFGTRGFHAVGVRDVCSAAKLTERYFYESFQNREALFVAVYELAVERVRAAVGDALVRAEEPERARAALRASLSMFRNDPRLARILLIEVLTAGADVGEASIAASQSFADQIGALTLERFPGLPKLGVDAGLLGNGLYGSTIYVTIQWVRGGFREPLERVLEHCVLFYDALTTELSQRVPARR
jgi:AcrR family transcriptional regulator